MSFKNYQNFRSDNTSLHPFVKIISTMEVKPPPFAFFLKHIYQKHTFFLENNGKYKNFLWCGRPEPKGVLFIRILTKTYLMKIINSSFIFQWFKSSQNEKFQFSSINSKTLFKVKYLFQFHGSQIISRGFSGKS